jgi:colicin import membrane protein
MAATSFREVATAEVAQLRRRESEIEARRLDHASPPADPVDLAEIAQRFDGAYVAVGAGGAPAPLDHETRFSYRRRLASGLERFSDDWRQTDLWKLPSAVMNAAEAQILDATIAVVGDHAIGNQDGSLREIKTRDISGREVTEWAGNPRVWLSAFAGPGKAVKRFKDPVTGQTLRPVGRRSI